MWVALRKRRNPPQDGADQDERGEGTEPAGYDVARIVHAEVAAGHSPQQPDHQDNRPDAGRQPQ